MEQFFTYIELVTNMCKFLNYEEQFKLSQVSSDLEQIIVNYVWKKNLDIIEITMMQMSFLVSDTLKDFNEFYYDYSKRDIWRRNSFILTSKNLNIFLNLNVNNIKKLQLNEHNRERDAYESIKNALPFRKKFPNLTELSCWKIEFEKMDLQQVAKNCEKLETLVLSNCTDLNGRLLEIGVGLDIQILKNIKNMNNLSIYGRNFTFSNIKNIINQQKLQQLTLEGTMVKYLQNINNDFNLRNLKYYKELNMPRFEANSTHLLYFQRNLLPHLENLCNLSLSSDKYISINRDFFNVLLESCKTLTRLVLKGFGINDFIALPSLEKLSLEDCQGLTYSHLKTVLSEMHLKCFKSRWIEYKGVFEYFPISPSLQKIDFYSDDDNDFIELLEFNETNLMNLTKLTYKWGESKVSNFAQNLKVLNTFQHLQEITLINAVAISDFLLLLKHENLQKISFMYINYTSDQKSEMKEMKNLHTNLRYLEMVRYEMELISDILLDLLNTNTKLSFACEFYEVASIIDTLNDGKFPKRFKNVKVCGVSIDCNSIRNRCEDAMNQMKNLIDSCEHMDAYFLLQ